MLTNRVIPCLLLSGDGLVKTKKFKNEVYVGDPINVIRIFNKKEVDEVALLDIKASINKQGPNFSLLHEIASECFMPLSYGGGITTVEQIYKLLHLGVEKVILNTSLYTDPEFIKKAVYEFGSQAIVASIDVLNKPFNRKEVMILAGTQGTKIDPVKYAKRVEDLGIGEILLTTINNEGLMNGYDLKLIADVSVAVNVPVIASGGAGSLDDLRKAVKEAHAHAVAAGSIFVFYGPHRAVLITYPEYHELQSLFR